MIEYLTVADLLMAAGFATAPEQPLIRDPGALASAAARPQTTVFGSDAYPLLSDKAAALLHSIVRNHPLVDGNERLGWLAAVGFCRRNGYDLRVLDPAEAETFVVGMAAGILDVDSGSKFIADHLTQR